MQKVKSAEEIILKLRKCQASICCTNVKLALLLFFINTEQFYSDLSDEFLQIIRNEL